MPVGAIVAIVGAGISLGMTINDREKKWQKENTPERFIFGENGDFSGTDFKPGQIHVRVYQQDPTLTKKEITAWLPLWKKNWVDVLNNRKDKWAKNHRQNVTDIYNRVKAEIAFALPEKPPYLTIEEGLRYFKGSKWEGKTASIQANVDRNRKKWIADLLAHKYKWINAGRFDPLKGYPEKTGGKLNNEMNNQLNGTNTTGNINSDGTITTTTTTDTNLGNATPGNDISKFAKLPIVLMVVTTLAALGLMYKRFKK